MYRGKIGPIQGICPLRFPRMEDSVRLPPQLGLLLGSALAFDVVLHLCTHRANTGGLI